MAISGISAYQSGNMLILGVAIAISVVLIYLKIVLLKHVKLDLIKKQEEKAKEQALANKKSKK